MYHRSYWCSLSLLLRWLLCALASALEVLDATHARDEACLFLAPRVSLDLQWRGIGLEADGRQLLGCHQLAGKHAGSLAAAAGEIEPTHVLAHATLKVGLGLDGAHGRDVGVGVHTRHVGAHGVGALTVMVEREGALLYDTRVTQRQRKTFVASRRGHVLHIPGGCGVEPLFLAADCIDRLIDGARVCVRQQASE